MTTNKLLAEFFDHPDGERLSQLLKDDVDESDDLDYKEQWPQGPKLARHILGFANSGGGCMIIGVKESGGGPITAIGVKTLIDITKIHESVAKFVPEDLKFEVNIIDASDSSSSKYANITGKKFQVLRVADQPEHLPFLATADGDDIKSNQIYVRCGASTRPATHTQLQKVLNRRIETAHSTGRELTLREHLDELKVLYTEQRPLSIYATALGLATASRLSYGAFIDQMIGLKQRTIEDLFGNAGND